MGRPRQRFIMRNGERVSLVRLSEETGISYQVLRYRHLRALPYELLISPPHVPTKARPRSTYI